jgi:hypothetical protein
VAATDQIQWNDGRPLHRRVELLTPLRLRLQDIELYREAGVPTGALGPTRL